MKINLPLYALLFFTLACASIATIRPLATATPSGAAASGSSSRTSSGFSAARYVDDRWQSKILSAAASGTPLATLLDAIKANPDAAGKQYGHRESGPTNFATQAEGVVEKVDTESRAGTLVIKPTGYSGAAEVRIAIGPVLRGTSIRDGSGVIPFSDFVNQIEYADVAEELNKRVLDTVLKPLDIASLKGKTIHVEGFFTGGDATKVVITPVRVEMKQ